MRLAAIADIHGNALALEAVLDDIARQNVEHVVNLGDHFSGPLEAARTADLLAARDDTTIRGNHDRWLVEQEPEAMAISDRAAYEQLTPAHLDWLRALPATASVDDDVFLCHGTPARDDTYWMERVDPDGSVLRAGMPAIEAMAIGLPHTLMLCGHTHLARSVQLADGRMIVNPGSVGCPAYDDDKPVHHVVSAGTPHACYAVIEKRHSGWDVSFRQVPYDHMAMSRLAHEQGRPDWAEALATGWIV